MHCQLTSLNTKLFCSCPSSYRGKPPNSNTCPVCLGLPGALPVLNKDAVIAATKVALALGSKISPRTLFYRKQYFYPDLSKGFQISQYDKAGGIPFAVGGQVTLRLDGEKTVKLRRIQLEEDPARLVHVDDDGKEVSLVDYNRSGTALVEIVTEPDISSPKEARFFLQKVQSILEHLEVTDSSLEGSMRCDANVSLGGGPRVEVKNISSFKDVERALNFELLRLSVTSDRSRRVTRRWDEAKKVTEEMRVKEEEQDYRYFPEADLPYVACTEDLIEAARKTMPELPDARRLRLQKQYGLRSYDAAVLVMDKGLADFFEEAAIHYKDHVNLGHWITTEVLRRLNYYEIPAQECKLRPSALAELLAMVDRGEITAKLAKLMLWDLVKSGGSPSALAKRARLKRIGDRDRLSIIVKKVLESDPKLLEDALRNDRAINFVTGKVLEETEGMGDPKIVYEIVTEQLEAWRRELKEAA
ncbi:MAG: Asp-tRNA(Asn)/Glu-tRNA(Gln) amidotransferase subunit GatB [Candidatus Brockarchaeota archaeon]|nr:Asp-tRNA(Asn)/Glu-tRNA(Gln) amidotransferase subunit GatB [Candidatus Brockarchaeota archaeon]